MIKQCVYCIRIDVYRMELSMEQSRFQTMEMTIKKVVIKIEAIAVFVWGSLPKSKYRTTICEF